MRMPREARKVEPFGDEAAGHRRPKVEVDLLRPVGRPEGRPDRLFLARVGDGDRGERVVRLAQEDAADVAVGWPSVGPDLVERHKEVRPGRSSAVLLEVPELVALP